MDNGLRTKDLWTNNASEWAGQYRGIFYKDLMETWTDILRIRTLPLWTTRITHVDIERIRMELSSPMVRMLKQSNLIAHAAALDIDTLELYTLFLTIVNGPDLEMTVQLLLPGLLLLLRQYNSARTFFLGCAVQIPMDIDKLRMHDTCRYPGLGMTRFESDALL
jgi:hypothetical protein